MTKREEMINIFSDYHKEAYGFRPRIIKFRELTLDELDRYFKLFQAEIERNNSIRDFVEAEAIEDFEVHIKDIQSICSCSREKAIKYYLMNAENGVNDDTEYWIRANMRGGTGVIYSNTWTTMQTSSITPFIFQYHRGDVNVTCNQDGACNGSNKTYDGNDDASGYPGYQQIGMTGASGIVPTPVYVWSNTWNGDACSGVACFGVYYHGECPTQHVQFGRDVIKNGTTPKPDYTAYTYPHPLTQETQVPDVPQPPSNLRISD